MIKRLPLLLNIVLIITLIIGENRCYAQSTSPAGEGLEQLLNHYNSGLDKVKKQVGATNDEFDVFLRFNQQRLDIEESKLYTNIKRGKINASNVEDYEQDLVDRYVKLYAKFQKIKVDYPSSVKEFGSYHPSTLQTYTCDSACTNPDFSNGDLYGWYAAYGKNSSVNSYNITGTTGAQCIVGQQKAARDPQTDSSWQVAIMHGGYDPVVPTVPRVSPYTNSAYSARIGDSTGTGWGVAILQQTFKVTTASENFTYQYAVFLENPTSHNRWTQPFFTAVVLDSLGDTIPACGKYFVTSGYQTGGKGWDSINSDQQSGSKLYYKNWTTVFTPLKKYVGQCVTMRFTVADCGQGGHFGYAYVSTSCSPTGVISSSPVFCGQKIVTLTGPPGADGYKWTGPTNGIVGSDSSQVINIDSSGTYRLVLTPITGSPCNDTLSIQINKGAGPAPVPSFTADTVCQGSGTQFVNTSSPIAGAGVKFYWDFYNQGSYQDSTTNPLWTYVTGGVFTVKLHELNNGCGKDTLIKVAVDSLVAPSFNVVTTCSGQPTNFTNTSTGSTSYSWNFGDTSSGSADTSTAANPSHTYLNIGTYTVELIGKGHLSCPPDTTFQAITVNSPPAAPIITGTDSVCQGSSTTLRISNYTPFNAYTWTPHQFLSCYTCRNTVATPTVTTTFTVTVDDFICTNDTTITIKVNPTPTAVVTVTPGDTICHADSTLLIGSGGCTYLWTPNNSTSDSIWVKPTLTASYSLQATSCLGCNSPLAIQPVIVLPDTATISLSQDSICPSSTTTITATGGTSYKWLPPLSFTTATVNVSPTINATYSVVVSSRCLPPDTLSQLVHVVQPPHITYTGSTTICAGQSTTLIAAGGTNYLWSSASTTTSGSTAILSPAGTVTYTLTVGDGNCLADSDITVTVNPLPTVTITPSDTICRGKSITLTATGGGTYKWSNNATTSSITVNPNADTTYKVSVNNGCVNYDSTSVTVIGPNLSVCCDDSLKIGDVVDLIATGASTYTWTPVTALSCTTCPDPVASPTVTTTYTVTGTDATGCQVDKALTVYIETPCADFKVPTVFTPNNDGINDDLVIKVLNPSAYSISIFDRWGKQVYNSSDATVYWNGRYNSTENLVPDGVYYYSIKASCGANEYDKKGFVEVLGEK